MSQQTPYEQIRFINDAIKDRQEKKLATFFSVKLERFGALTPLATKESGENFYETIIQYLTKYDMSAMLIELYNGKSYNIKEPFQTFKIIVKRNAELSGGEDSNKEDLKITPTETVITNEKHFFSMAEKERQVMMLEFENRTLRYELEEFKKKNKKKKNYIQELEAELGRSEKEKKNSLGNISLGLVGANAIERLVKSPFGMAALKGLGMPAETVNGLLGTSQNEQKPEQSTETTETKSTATLIANTSSQEAQKQTHPLTKEEQKRAEIKKYINEFLDSCSDTTLRYYYELIQYLGADNASLQSIVEQIKTFRQVQEKLASENAKKTSESKPIVY